ncbi:MAG TPA: Maf family protein, partial [Chloroflexota bacterium]|nr:Maf family protein [Chloroflexota bacterium]
AALNVAAAKCRSVESAADEIVLAADTLVVIDGEVLGKPANATDAHAMLSRLRGRPHQVLTGVALRSADQRQWGAVVSTSVFIRAYQDKEVAAYVERGEPFDKAGGYAIQDTDFRPVENVAGCYLNVVGLPLCAVGAGLAALGVDSARADDLRPPCSFCRTGGPLVAIRSTS